MNRGFVHIWRKTLDSGWLRNHKLWAFWSWCLLKASYKEFDAIVGLQVVHLMPGQFVFGRQKAAQETGLTEREIRTIIAFLIKCGNLTIKTTNKFSIITIVNWHTYQSREDESDQQSDQQVTNKGPHTIIKEYKNINNTSESDNSDHSGFDTFYQKYPKHEGKKKALDAWMKIDPDENLQAIILMAIENQIQHKVNLKASNAFCPEWPLPATWLNGRRWEDEVQQERPDPSLSSAPTPAVEKCPRCGHRIVVDSDFTPTGCVYCQKLENNIESFGKTLLESLSKTIQNAGERS